MLIRHPLNITQPGLLDRTGAPGIRKELGIRTVQMGPSTATLRSDGKSQNEQSTAHRRFNEDFDKTVRFSIKVQERDQVYIARLSRRVQSPDCKATDPLIAFSDNKEETATEESRKLLSRTAASYSVQSVTVSTVTIYRDGMDVPLSLDPVTRMPAVLKNLKKDRGYAKQRLSSNQACKRTEGKNSSPPDLTEPEPADHATD